MATQPKLAAATVNLEKLASIPHLRVLAWDGDQLYASRGYTVFKFRPERDLQNYVPVGEFRPALWRMLTSRSRLASRLVRDGFHALAIHPRGNVVGAVPGAIVTLAAGEKNFQPTHKIARGTRPLHIALTPAGRMLWGEYFDNPRREEVQVYASDDGGLHWDVAYTFPCRSVRHVHNIVYDEWQGCIWILTGDYGCECRILRASTDLRTIEEVVSGNQQARAVAAIPSRQGLYFASDTPLEQNHVHLLDRHGRIHRVSDLPSSCIYGCRSGEGMFFSTMVEPSAVNPSRAVKLFGSVDGNAWSELAAWQKDSLPMKYFQYGNAFLPDGANTTSVLAVTTLAVKGADLQTHFYKVASA